MRFSVKSDLVDIEVAIVTEIDGAFLVKWDPDKEAVWIPKSVCEFEQTDARDIGILTLSARVAEEKEML